MEIHDDSSYSPYAKMSRDQPNPLRPYYVPASIGITPTQTSPSSPPLPPRRPPSNSTDRDFRELFSDLDYGDYLSGASPSVAGLAKKLMDEAIWNYTSVLLAQPFEVAKVVLQVHDAGASAQDNGGFEEKSFSGRAHDYSYSDSDSDSEAPSYFMPTTPDETPSYRASKRPNHSRSNTSRTNVSHTAPPPFPTQTTTIRLTKPDSLLEVISQLWSKESAFGVWKGTNSTFIYGVLLKTIETWTRSCLSAILDIPDPTLLNAALGIRNGNGPTILDSPSPIASLSVVVTAAAVAGCLLAPIDIVRTRLMTTPTSTTPRALLPSLRTLPGLTCPPTLLPITLLHSSLPALLSTSLPLFFRTWLRIDPLHTPAAHSVSAFLISLAELFCKLPLETVLRRGHLALLTATPPAVQTSNKRAAAPELLPLHTTGLHAQQPKFQTIVPAGPYRGILGTMLYIVHEEGMRAPPASGPPTPSRASSQASMRSSSRVQALPESRRTAANTHKRGQGLAGLWRGWRVGFWGIVGMYAAAGLGGAAAAGGEF